MVRIMKEFSRNKQYRTLEKSLERKYKSRRENEIALTAEDFQDGKLTAMGYLRLKQQCDYIDESFDVEIKLPCDCKEYAENLKETLGFLGMRELAQVKRERRKNSMAALILLFGGILCFGLSYGVSLLDIIIVKDIIIIASWVFVWGAVEKQFFGSKDLRDKRLKILQTLSAKITIPREDNEIIK